MAPVTPAGAAGNAVSKTPPIDEEPEYVAPLHLRPWLLLAAVAVALLLLGATYYYGVGPFAAPSHPAATVADRPTYRQAEAAALTAARAYQAVSWTVVLAQGLDPPSGGTLPVNNTATAGLGPFACTVSPIPPAGSRLTLPGDPSEADDGGATGWMFIFTAGVDVDVAVWVAAGTATAVATLAGGACATQLKDVSALGASVLDSSNAVTIGLDAGGAAFRERYPNATVELFAEGPESANGASTPPVWQLTWAACDPSSASAGTLVPAFNATVQAESGALLGSSNNSAICPFPSPVDETVPS